MQQQNRRPNVGNNGQMRRYPQSKGTRPIGGSVQRPARPGAARPVAGRPNAGRPAASRQQRPPQRPPQRTGSPREWVYPEGYRPPQKKQPPRQPQRKAPPQRRPKQKQDYSFLWVFLGELAVRLLIGILVGMAIVGLLYKNKFYTTPSDDREDVVYTFSHMEDGKEVVNTLEVPASRAYLGDELMVSFSDIAAWLDMAQVGDIHTMRFVVRESGIQSVVFHYNSHNAFIGHEIVVMNAETRFANGEVWVPLSFVQICMKGFDIAVEGENVKISRNSDAPGFALRASEPIAPCKYPE